METVLFGFAQADITPEGSVQTVGFGRPDEHTRGVRAPLIAQACVFEGGKTRCCLVAIDHIGFLPAHADALRDRIAAKLHIGRAQVMLCFSHTHAAPNDSAEPAYYASACAQIEEAAARAAGQLSPVYAACGNAAGQIGVNRRSESGALDTRIGVLALTDAAGVQKLILLRLTAHANVLKADNFAISPDYFGAVRDRLESVYGCPVVLTQGASGNVAPKYFDSALTPPDAPDARFIRSKSALSDMAQSVLESVRPVLAALSPKPAGAPVMESHALTLCADVPNARRAEEIAAEAQRFCGIDGTGWLAETERLRAAGITEQTERIEVQYFRFGRFCLCGVPSEIMCEFALRASALLHDEYFYFGGYTNGCTGYFPTEAEFDLGGFEVYWSMLIYYMYYGRVFPLRRDSAETLIRFAVQNVPGRLT